MGRKPLTAEPAGAAPRLSQGMAAPSTASIVLPMTNATASSAANNAVPITRAGMRRTGNKFLRGGSATTEKIESVSTKSGRNVAGRRNRRRGSRTSETAISAILIDLSHLNERGL